MATEGQEGGDKEEQEQAEVTPDFSKKHPLEHRWTLWFDNPQAKQSLNKYGTTLRSVYTFDTVEDFWCLYNNIRTPGQLQPTATFYVFKEGIEPKWEDPKNTNGGCWTASMDKGGPTSKAQIDAWWLNAVLACIGEQFSEGDEICGVAVNIRNKGDRIEMWTKTSSNEAVQTIIGRQLKEVLGCPDKIGYSVFADKLSNTNRAKDRYRA
mmetsp:Transcript_11476/g.20290  ORF Transcript_11476/g.20290 Transcript_11476/m.20290 type:complete len:209 (+) Transcript_11476:65-691(+)|eukprot:CAMPEP_0119101484 /NCGR_PEP_ID=MMETSP1180-20130426/520_1 /TAXON_ID=3052 ORGANISM="Chlamydomonas cf sp, Strain CCMP681" /NCGR_SAMPLE_ID=MMETSP1180 /ASSEMBLY_ACC=CAM_ASM_000741 /LENGTH=208 /DNA_ID=CAMNT_0007085609 /DNA_START=69 /DNA_END=695 /DNA_ORIENTATION=+